MTAPTDQKRDTIVLGASAGGIDALQRILPAFSRSLEAAIFVVLHLPAAGKSVLDEVLGRATPLKTAFAVDGEAILPRRVYLAPPDRHLLLNGDRIELLRGPRENRARPAIDPLFRSAAAARGGRVLGAVLSGLLDDGAAGLHTIKRCGGLAFAQSPEDATERDMPEHAVAVLGEALDAALPADALGARLAELVGSPASAWSVPEDVWLELRMLRGEASGLEALADRGPPVPLTCPECSGPLWHFFDDRLDRYRCHTGHTFGNDSLLSAQGQQIEQALWAALKGLEQRSRMLADLAKRRGPAGPALGEARLLDESARLQQHAQILRNLLHRVVGERTGVD